MNDKKDITTSLRQGTADKSLLADISTDVRWAAVLDEIMEIVEDVDSTDRSKIKDATVYLMSGLAVYETAQRVGTSRDTVRAWLRKYPIMAHAIKMGRGLLDEYRVTKLAQQFDDAIAVSQNILTLNPSDEDVNVKALGIQALHARWVIDMFLKNRVEVNIKADEDTMATFRATTQALNLIADLIEDDKEDNIIDVNYRIITEDKETAPIVNEKGEPFYGEMGVLDVDDENRVLCHICGERIKGIKLHVYGQHDMTPQKYELAFMLSDGELKEVDNG